MPLKARITKYTTSTVRVMTAAVVATGMVGSSVLAAPASFVTDSFTGASTTPNGWTYGGNNYSACLTAGDNSAGSIPKCSEITEAVGSGVLRLTDNGSDRAGFAIYNKVFHTGAGIDITFDSYQYNGSNADGISFFLIDGSKSPTKPGMYGEGLGYEGIDGGYVGVGLDAQGNFSRTNGVTDTGPGVQPNKIVLRGNQATKYKYIQGVSPARNLQGTTRANSAMRVHITIDKDNIMNIEASFDGGATWPTKMSNIDLSTVNGAGSLPETLKLGFAGSTGSFTDIHEIQNLVVQSILTPVIATDDTITTNGSATLGNVFGNDTLGTTQPSAATATTSLLDDGGTGITLAADGTLTASKTLQPGTYTLQYQICETASPTNCSTATVTITVPNVITVLPAPTAAAPVKAPNTGRGMYSPYILVILGVMLLTIFAAARRIRARR